MKFNPELCNVRNWSEVNWKDRAQEMERRNEHLALRLKWLFLTVLEHQLEVATFLPLWWVMIFFKRSQSEPESKTNDGIFMLTCLIDPWPNDWVEGFFCYTSIKGQPEINFSNAWCSQLSPLPILSQLCIASGCPSWSRKFSVFKLLPMMDLATSTSALASEPLFREVLSLLEIIVLGHPQPEVRNTKVLRL